MFPLHIYILDCNLKWLCWDEMGGIGLEHKGNKIVQENRWTDMFKAAYNENVQRWYRQTGCQ